MARIWHQDECYATVFPKEDDAMPTRKPNWIRPADRPTTDGDGPVSTPKSVLIDPQAYIDDERNATTADYVSDDQDCKHVQVTFWIAHPPRVSYFTVHRDGVEPAAFRRMPKVIATDQGVALLRVPWTPSSPEEMRDRDFFRDCLKDRYFLYHSTGTDGRPWLRLVPKPDTRSYLDKEIGLLTNGDDFFLAIVRPVHLTVFPYFSSEQRSLHLFDSRTWEWTTKFVYIDSPKKSCLYPVTHKVITIGGRHGSIGWVNLWHGILIYDVLLGDNVLRYIPLPSLVPRNCDGNPSNIRDIAAVDGCIKYFSMYHTTNNAGDWQADAWRMKDDPREDWQHDCHFGASEIMVDNPRHLEMLPDLLETVPNRPVLTRFYAGNPALSLHDDGVVYIMIKTCHLDQNAWVLAIDLNTMALKGVAKFSTSRTADFNYLYTQSGISKHMGVEVEDDVSNQSEEALWIEVSHKKNKLSRSGPPPGAGGHLGMGSRGELMGLDNGRAGSGVSGAGTGRGRGRGRGRGKRRRRRGGRELPKLGGRGRQLLFGTSAIFVVWLSFMFSQMFVLPTKA